MKNLLTIGLIAAGAMYYFGKNKVQDYSQIAKQLKIKFLGVSGISLKSSTLKFKTNIRITNTSPVDLSLSTGNNIVLRKIKFFTPSGDYLGEATPNVSGIVLPANAHVDLKDIPTVLPLTNLGNLFGDALDIISNPAILKTQFELEVFGKSITINGTA